MCIKREKQWQGESGGEQQNVSSETNGSKVYEVGQTVARCVK